MPRRAPPDGYGAWDAVGPGADPAGDTGREIVRDEVAGVLIVAVAISVGDVHEAGVGARAAARSAPSPGHFEGDVVIPLSVLGDGCSSARLSHNPNRYAS